ncbi:hypothetical protein [Marinibactrum halimedae]|uniref:Uncharacterized protein n=1 Tax=Marinibactrum halimedae TaxID=1444977 RepID=A0AA37TB24_9GAMM|nr:hypothetical protein [Marinibactrum halimedae]MCD9460363.1 hypothetical protein [Marinibactrum halimedae]GLS26800.1 hypothetical protein GCM10007877_25190 [Marinibactrum halimedae]
MFHLMKKYLINISCAVLRTAMPAHPSKLFSVSKASFKNPYFSETVFSVSVLSLKGDRYVSGA